MEIIADFFKQNIVIIYFFYGLSFFCMGMFVWVESGRASTFRLARAMGPLAGFGIFHGLHEWIEMFQNMPNAYLLPAWVLSDSLRLIHLVLSFVLLVLFGVRLIYTNHQKSEYETLFSTVATGTLLLLWGTTVWITQRVYQLDQADLLTAVDVLARYILGIPGALLAAWAIIIEQQSFYRYGLTRSGNDLMRAAMALILYGIVGQIFVKASFLFPSNIINSDLFIRTFGVPVQLFRAFAATIMAIYVVRALRAFEFERQKKLMDANEARLAAQTHAMTVQQQAHQDTERLNSELKAAVQDLTLLFDFSRSMASSLDRNMLINTAVSHIANTLSWINGAAILWQQRSNQPFQIVSTAGFVPNNGSAWETAVLTLSNAIAEQQQNMILHNNEVLPLSQIPPSTPTSSTGSSFCGFPLFVEEQLSSILVIQLNETAIPNDQQATILLQTLIGLLSIAIENATLYQKVNARGILRGELLHQIVSAQEHERQRIARELHDGTGQYLTGMGLGLAAASTSVHTNPDIASSQLTTLKQMSMEALSDLRALIADLRPSLLDNLGLIPAVQNQVELFKQRMADNKITINVAFEKNGRIRRLDPNIETIAFRIIQEALTNISKHAHATEVVIQLTYKTPCLHILLSDNGCGFDSEDALAHASTKHAWGLLGMKERVALVGGTFNLKAQIDEGTTIDVCLPLIDEGDENAENSIALG
ncbi:MAG: sensor histidine kinase [Chloroflexi bacterium]|nr:sensor histidine kinase [Chloroflexota bacterium]